MSKGITNYSFFFLLWIRKKVMRIHPLLFFLAALANVGSFRESDTLDSSESEKWDFKDYISKFNPVKVWEKLNNKKYDKKDLKNITIEDLKAFTQALNPLDDLLKLNIENANPNFRRSFYPKGDIDTSDKLDPFNVKQRLHELMKLTIYQVREKMVLMQLIQEEFNNYPLYMMGFITSKVDAQIRAIGRIGYMGLKFCEKNFYPNSKNSTYMHAVIDAEERLLNYWVEAEILVEMLKFNDRTWKKLLYKEYKAQKKLQTSKETTTEVPETTTQTTTTKKRGILGKVKDALTFWKRKPTTGNTGAKSTRKWRLFNLFRRKTTTTTTTSTTTKPTTTVPKTTTTKLKPFPLWTIKTPRPEFNKVKDSPWFKLLKPNQHFLINKKI